MGLPSKCSHRKIWGIIIIIIILKNFYRNWIEKVCGVGLNSNFKKNYKLLK